MSTRQDLADALGGVPGVTGLTLPPDVIQPGMAWPVWRSSTPITGTDYEVTYDVFLTLPAGSPGASIAEADDSWQPVAFALLHVGAVSLIEPVTMATDPAGAGLPAIRFTLTTLT